MHIENAETTALVKCLMKIIRAHCRGELVTGQLRALEMEILPSLAPTEEIDAARYLDDCVRDQEDVASALEGLLDLVRSHCQGKPVSCELRAGAWILEVRAATMLDAFLHETRKTK